jgi:hypothetical protein
VTDKDRAKVTLAADAAGLKLLEPSSSQARHKQGKVLDSEVIIRPPGLHGEVIVLELMVWVGLAIILGDVRQRSEPPRVGGHSDRRPERLGAKVIRGAAPYLSL